MLFIVTKVEETRSAVISVSQPNRWKLFINVSVGGNIEKIHTKSSAQEEKSVRRYHFKIEVLMIKISYYHFLL